MMKYIRKPFLPYVQLDGIGDFDIDRPETHRYSRFVNAMLEAFASVHPVTGTNVAKFLDLPYSAIVGTLRTETGLSYTQFYELWLKHRVLKTIQRHPELTTEELAQEIGFGNRSTLWKFLHKHKMVYEPGRNDYEPRNCVAQLLRIKEIPENNKQD